MCLSERPRLAAAQRVRLIARLRRNATMAAQHSKASGRTTELSAAFAAFITRRQ